MHGDRLYLKMIYFVCPSENRYQIIEFYNKMQCFTSYELFYVDIIVHVLNECRASIH